MRSIGLEQLVLIAVFVLIPLLSVLGRWLRERAGKTRPRGPGPPAPVTEVTPPPLGLPPRARRVEPVLPAARLPRTAPPAAVDRRPRASALLGGPAGMRRAVVAMTILGPCRALEEPPPAGPGAEPVPPSPRSGG